MTNAQKEFSTSRTQAHAGDEKTGAIQGDRDADLLHRLQVREFC